MQIQKIEMSEVTKVGQTKHSQEECKSSQEFDNDRSVDTLNSTIEDTK